MTDPNAATEPSATTDPTLPHPRRRREPAFNLPGVVLASCLVLLAIHAVRRLISVEADNTLLAVLAFMPARVSIAMHLFPAAVTAAYQALADRNPLMAEQIAFLIGDGRARWWTFLTYAFLHGSWAHVGFNCVWLVAFGSPVARRFTSARFLLLLVAAALAGSATEYAYDPTGFQIVIGASAAVSGAMGAAVRFVFRPSDEAVRSFDRARMEEAFRQPALSLKKTFTTRAALLFIVVWFTTNLLFGAVPGLAGIGDGPIAWQAHIGGFLTGLLLFPLFEARRVPAETSDTDAASPTGPEAKPEDI